MFSKDDFILLGTMCVDSGQAIIIDPCYLRDWKHGNFILDRTATPEEQNNYNEACQATVSKEMYGPVMDGLGVAFSTGWGDGCYNVYGLKQHNRIAAVFVDFMDIFSEEQE